MGPLITRTVLTAILLLSPKILFNFSWLIGLCNFLLNKQTKKGGLKCQLKKLSNLQLVRLHYHRQM